MAHQRLSKVLAAAGVASRRACEELIFQGKVTVNGQPIFIPQTHVNPSLDRITCNGQVIAQQTPKVVFMLNKPRGYICSNKRYGEKKILLDLLPDISMRLFSIGRLDRDTSGLILVTNDGHFAHKVMHPRFEISKEYLVKTKQEITHQHLMLLSQGIIIDKQKIKPIRVKKVRNGTVKITVKEGKKHEIRFLIRNSGLALIELKRIRIGGLCLGTLPEGGYRKLSELEKELILGV